MFDGNQKIVRIKIIASNVSCYPFKAIYLFMVLIICQIVGFFKNPRDFFKEGYIDGNQVYQWPKKK